LPGLTLFVAQPHPGVTLDYSRGLVSRTHRELERCLSNFPVLWYDTVAKGGLFAVLGATGGGRIFGFGTVTRASGAARRHEATLEVCVHENYAERQSELFASLLAACRSRGVERVHAFVPAQNEAGLAAFKREKFIVTGRLPDALHLNNGPADVVTLALRLPV
jgi:L-amino acid N-acyltransferase YncA